MTHFTTTNRVPTHRALFELVRSTDRFKVYEEMRANSPPDGSTHNLGTLYLDKDVCPGIDHVGVHIELGMAMGDEAKGKLDRSQAVNLIKRQLNAEKPGCSQHHYGRVELRELLDAIYGGPPLNEAEMLNGMSDK